MNKFIAFVLFVTAINAKVVSNAGRKGASLKPLSVCCDIPEIGATKHLETCSNRALSGPCNDVQCIFDESGFLIDNNTLNNETYRNYLLNWVEEYKEWSVAVDKVIEDCVDTKLRQHLDYPCKAYDVFACTGIAMLKKCPNSAWKC